MTDDQQQKKRKVLVVDDDLAVNRLVQMNLAAEGFDVVSATDGLEALEVFDQEQPDLVILDIHMPKLTGWDVLWDLRNRPERSDVPVIMLTIEADGRSITKGWARGVDCYLPKPFDPAELTLMVKRLLEVADEYPFPR